MFVCTGAEGGKDEQPDSSVTEPAYSYGQGKVYLHYSGIFFFVPVSSLKVLMNTCYVLPGHHFNIFAPDSIFTIATPLLIGAPF